MSALPKTPQISLAYSNDGSNFATNNQYEHHGSKTKIGFGGGSGGNGMEIKDYIDAQDDKTRAQNDARFAEVIARLETISATMIGQRQFWAAAFTGIVATAGIILAALAISGDRFDGGLAANGLLAPLRDEQTKRDAVQDAKVDAILQKIDSLASKVDAISVRP